MKIARPLFPIAMLCAVFCASVLPGRPAAAQSEPPTTTEEPGRDARWAGDRAGDRASDRANDSTTDGASGSGDGASGSGEGASDQPRRLEQALERYREIERRGGWGKVPTELAMGPDYSYDCLRIAALEKRLIVEGYLREFSPPPPAPPLPEGRKPPPPSPEQLHLKPVMGLAGPCKYGPKLTAAMQAFQSDRKVLGFGQLGRLSMAELNRPVQEIVNILEHDIERWKRVSLQRSGTYLLVNIPFFQLTAYENGRQSLSMPVIVGLPSKQTPLFSDELEYVILNPDWGIPDTIAKQEYWPSARRDPNYLRYHGITATGGSLRQKPGPRNPLGRIKFVMPNQNDVYLHDTPEQRAFTAAVRALSHGCIRLSQPLDLAHYLLRDDPEWKPNRIEAGIASGKTLQINLRRHMPVHIIYSTSWVNDEGRVEIRPDVYGMNRGGMRQEEDLSPTEGEQVNAWP